MKNCLQLFFCLFLFNLAFATSDLQKSPRDFYSDSVLIEAWIEAALERSETDTDSAQFFATKALKKARKHKWKLGMAKSYNAIAAAKFPKELATTRSLRKKALTLFREIDHLEGVATTYSNLCVEAYRRAEYDSALEYGAKAVTYFGELDHVSGKAVSLLNLANVYNALGDFNKDLEYSIQAAEMFHSHGYLAEYGMCLNNIGDSYNRSGRPETALRFLFRAARIKDSLELHTTLGNTYITIWETYQKLERISEGIPYLRSAHVLFVENRDVIGQVTSKSHLAQLHFEHGHTDSAIAMAFDAFQQSLVVGVREHQYELAESLEKYHKASGDQESAVKFGLIKLKLHRFLTKGKIKANHFASQATAARENGQSVKAGKLVGNNTVRVVSISLVVLLILFQLIGVYYYHRKKGRPITESHRE